MVTFISCLAIGSSARATVAEPSATQPLLVVVETGPGADCDGAMVRSAIAAELHTTVGAPVSSPVALAGPRADTLLVSIDRARIVVTLRGRGDEDLTRSVAAPADRAARLRVVAWLAGNVARDQLATLALPDAAAATPTTQSAPTTEPVAPAPSRTEPSRFAAPPTNVDVQPETSSIQAPRWTLGLVGGPALMFGEALFSSPGGYRPSPTPSWRPVASLELHRDLDAWFVGAAVDAAPGSTHPVGVAAIAGALLRLGRLELEPSVGGGLEAFESRTFLLDAPSTSKMITRGFFRATFAASFPLWRDLDALAQVGGHLTATSSADAAYAVAAFGLRIRLL